MSSEPETIKRDLKDHDGIASAMISWSFFLLDSAMFHIEVAGKDYPQMTSLCEVRRPAHKMAVVSE
ncbi:MAG: hypothetical protein ACK526_00645 [Planctomyces sp.]